MNKKTISILLGIFAIVILLNTFFNASSGIAYNPDGDTLGTRFYLSGPDPYYNMRTCEEMLERGSYPFLQSQESDPLLNYPVGQKWARPPLFNTITVASASLLSLTMPITDALGWCMLFLPALYGALAIFPIYGIGKEIISKRVGIIAAFFTAIIPIHIGAGHGSSFSLYDHDSFLFLLFSLLFFFVIKSLKEKNHKQASIWACGAGVIIASITMTWVASKYIIMVLLVYLAVQFILDIFRCKFDARIPQRFFIMSISAYLICLPYLYLTQNLFSFTFIFLIGSLVITGIYMFFDKHTLPWTLSVPLLGGLGALGLGFIYAIRYFNIKGALGVIADFIYGYGIYGDPVSWTIGEASNFTLSQTVMAFGPVLYWLGIAGFILFLQRTFKNKLKTYDVFFCTLFIITFWLSSTAGRFLNDMIPCLTIFAAYILIRFLTKLDYQSLKDKYRAKGISGIKSIKIKHIIGILLVLFLFYSNAFLALDAAIPHSEKANYFGEDYVGVYGLSLGKSVYWSDALLWLSQQDTDINLPEDRPAVISWWDYGFYEVAMGEHPTVADNYQSGIPPASNFKTATSEEEAVTVLCIRLCEGSRISSNPVQSGTLSQEIQDVWHNYLTSENASLVIQYIKNPETSPSYNTYFCSEYGNNQIPTTDDNAMYHDCTSIILSELDDEQITNLYMDLQQATGYEIRYYMTETYDQHIFGVFTFLANKGCHGFIGYEDDYTITSYMDKNTGMRYTESELNNMSINMRQELDLTYSTDYKQSYYETFWYQVWHGATQERIPTYMLTHFVPVYMSPYVIITEYFEGATITGTVHCNGFALQDSTIVLLDAYGIPHDTTQPDQNGKFSILAPAGNITLELFTGSEYVTTLSNFTISQEEAKRELAINHFSEYNIDAVNCTLQTNSTGTLTVINSVYPFISYEIPLNTTNQSYSLTSLIPGKYTCEITNSTGNITLSQSYYITQNKTIEL